jgi:hypothetical protein
LNLLFSLLVAGTFWTFVLGFLYRSGRLDPDKANEVIARKVAEASVRPLPAFSALEYVHRVLKRIYAVNGRLSFWRFVLFSLVVGITASGYLYSLYRQTPADEGERVIGEIERRLLGGPFAELRAAGGTQAHRVAFELATGKTLVKWQSYSDESKRLRQTELEFRNALDRAVLEHWDAERLGAARLFSNSSSYQPGDDRTLFGTLFLVTLATALIDFLAAHLVMAYARGIVKSLTAVALIVVALFIVSVEIYTSLFRGGVSIALSGVAAIVRTFLLLLSAVICVMAPYYFLSVVSQLASKQRVLRGLQILGAVLLAALSCLGFGASFYFGLNDTGQAWHEFLFSSAMVVPGGFGSELFAPKIMSISALAPLTITFIVYGVVYSARVTGWSLERAAVTLLEGARLAGATYLGALITVVTVSVSLILMLHRGLVWLLG